jgi:hypothetical protein
MTPSRERLAALEDAVDRALAGDEAALEVLGYGEVSSVVALDGRLACKRMPPFPTGERAAAFCGVLERYLEALGRAGVPVLPTEIARLERADGRHVVYCLQPIVDAAALGPRRLAAASEAEAGALFDEICERVTAAVGPGLGIDGQLSNWVWVDGRATLLDVSTPFLRDERGRELLDTEMYMDALPWVLRGFARRFLLASIFDKYYQPRGVVLDLLGNLYKERLGHLVPALVARANRRLSPPIAAREPARFYRGDRWTWAMLQAARRADRAWQRRVRRRTYPYLLPGRIER